MYLDGKVVKRYVRQQWRLGHLAEFNLRRFSFPSEMELGEACWSYVPPEIGFVLLSFRVRRDREKLPSVSHFPSYARHCETYFAV
jgi:hypothetical protein